MKKIILLGSIVMLTACATLSEKGSKVQLIVVQGSEREIKAEQEKLEKENCKFIKKVEAAIAPGSSNNDVDERLIIGLKNEVGEQGGNAVISSLNTHGFPMKTFGLAYSCPAILGVDTNI